MEQPADKAPERLGPPAGTYVQAELDALRHRAYTRLANYAFSNRSRRDELFNYSRGYAQALRELERGAGLSLAIKDERLGGYKPPPFLRGALQALNINIESLSIAEIRERVAQAGIEVAIDPVEAGDGAALQVIDRAIAIVDMHDKHAVGGVVVGDRALHEASVSGAAS